MQNFHRIGGFALALAVSVAPAACSDGDAVQAPADAAVHAVAVDAGAPDAPTSAP